MKMHCGSSTARMTISTQRGRRSKQTLTRENLASARMPEPAKGTYALIATVELPALQPGWNMIAYTLPNTRTVDSALTSLDGSYSVLYSYVPGDESSWQSFDPEASSLYGELADLVNDLDELSFGHSYLIYATEAVTPYLAISDGPPVRYLPPRQVIQSTAYCRRSRFQGQLTMMTWKGCWSHRRVSLVRSRGPCLSLWTK